MGKTFEGVVKYDNMHFIRQTLEFKNMLNILNEEYGLNLNNEWLPPTKQIFKHTTQPPRTVTMPHPHFPSNPYLFGLLPRKAGIGRYSLHNLLRTVLPKWYIEDGRVRRSCSGDLVKSYRFEPQTSKERSFLDLIEVIDRLLMLEMIYPSQRFLRYFNAKCYLELWSKKSSNRNTTISECLIDLTLVGYPTTSRLHYLQWKEFLSGYCEYSAFIKTGKQIDERSITSLTTTEFPDERSFDALLVRLRDSLRRLVWRAYWGDQKVTWSTRVTDVEGKTQTVFIHEHELSNFKDFPRDSIKTPPRNFYHQEYLLTLERKKKRLTNPTSYVSFTKEQLNRYQHQVIPISNSLALINEGRLMKHCIGGETYLDYGESGNHVYFRFIPRREDPRDLTKHFTVTLGFCLDSAPHADPDMGKDDVVEDNRPYCRNLGAQDIEGLSNYQLLEVWGYDNAVPDFYTMREIYSFLCSNTGLFQSLAKNHNKGSGVNNNA